MPLAIAADGTAAIVTALVSLFRAALAIASVARRQASVIAALLASKDAVPATRFARICRRMRAALARVSPLNGAGGVATISAFRITVIASFKWLSFAVAAVLGALGQHTAFARVASFSTASQVAPVIIFGVAVIAGFSPDLTPVSTNGGARIARGVSWLWNDALKARLVCACRAARTLR